jgi:hypothetical protein
MPRIEKWSRLPVPIRGHLVERMRIATPAWKISITFASGSKQTLKCQMDSGSKTSVLSKIVRRRQVSEDISSSGTGGDWAEAVKPCILVIQAYAGSLMRPIEKIAFVVSTKLHAMLWLGLRRRRR